MAQSSWSAVVARLKAQLETITGIGRVHDRLRLAANEERFNELALSEIGGEDRARMWMIRLERMETSFADASGSLQWNRVALIEGFLQIEDANSSEHTATALAESICRTLAADLQATKLGATVLSGGPPGIMVNEPRIFVFVPCHYVRIEMPVLSIEQ